MKFVLDKTLAAESDWICNLSLCEVRLSLNAAFPWIILVPRVADAVEIIDLSADNQLQLLKEIAFSSQIMKTLFHPTKLNVANLGNMVSQLHVHIIARFNTDLAWPTPVWNSGVTKAYGNQEKSDKISQIAAAFKEHA